MLFYIIFIHVINYLRKYFKGNVIASGSYDASSAIEGITNDKFDLIAIGRDLIANPDYVKKLINKEKITEYNESMLSELY